MLQVGENSSNLNVCVCKQTPNTHSFHTLDVQTPGGQVCGQQDINVPIPELLQGLQALKEKHQPTTDHTHTRTPGREKCPLKEAAAETDSDGQINKQQTFCTLTAVE